MVWSEEQGLRNCQQKGWCGFQRLPSQLGRACLFLLLLSGPCFASAGASRHKKCPALGSGCQGYPTGRPSPIVQQNWSKRVWSEGSQGGAGLGDARRQGRGRGRCREQESGDVHRGPAAGRHRAGTSAVQHHHLLGRRPRGHDGPFAIPTGEDETTLARHH